tara:strand:+ start:891 stop:1355 length:465 start_codon:yes stop_codon:yes gene_type:complete
MKSEYMNIYNNLVKLTRNKDLYKYLKKQDTFSDRLTLLLLHFAFFLKAYKNDKNRKDLQDIYDFIFRQLELSIREIGYGDQSINKKMKIYLNLFHDIIDKIHYWEKKSLSEKRLIFTKLIDISDNDDYLTEYFDLYLKNLLKKSLNFQTKRVIN